MSRVILLLLLIVFSTSGYAQWTGQSSAADLTSPISRSGIINLDGYNSAQIRLNSGGTYYGKIGNPSPQLWSLGYGTSGTDINPVMSWNPSGQVGIGATPLSKLHISALERYSLRLYKDGNTTNYLSLWQGVGGAGIDPIGTGLLYLGYDQSTNVVIGNNGGNLGINTLPAYPLDVFGSGARIKNTSTSSAAYTTFRLQGPDYTNGLEIDFFGNNNISSDLNWSYGGGPGSVALVNVNAKPLTFGTSNLGRMIIDGTGNVGIGTFSPNQKLTVNGTIYGKEVKVDLSVPGPDYVFEKAYALPSLESIKSFIDQNKHLPEIPSAKEMEANGINLSEMNMLLLKKVEELTLYVIELKKENQSLSERLTKIENKND